MSPSKADVRQMFGEELHKPVPGGEQRVDPALENEPIQRAELPMHLRMAHVDVVTKDARTGGGPARGEGPATILSRSDDLRTISATTSPGRTRINESRALGDVPLAYQGATLGISASGKNAYATGRLRYSKLRFRCRLRVLKASVLKVRQALISLRPPAIGMRAPC